MNIFKLKTRKSLTLFVLITVSHFIVTTACGHYVGKRIGEQTAPVIEQFFDKVFNGETKAGGVEKLANKAKSSVADIAAEWKPVTLALSFPVIYFLEPFMQDIRESWLYGPVKSEVMSREQYSNRNHILQYIAFFINSVAFSLLTLGIYKLYRKINPFNNSHNI